MESTKLAWVAGLLSGCLLFAPASRADDAKPAWAGVWQGTVGTAKVRMCLQHSEYGDELGAYYYERILKLIALQSPANIKIKSDSVIAQETLASAKTSATGEGSAPAQEEVAVWTMRAGAGGQTLAGTWRSRSKELPVSLTRVVATHPAVNPDETPCEGDAFNAPREVEGRIKSTIAKFESRNAEFRKLTVGFAGRHADNSIQSFELLRNDAGAQAFNKTQRAAMVEDQGELAGCSRSMAGRGLDGDYEAHTEPVALGQHWLVVQRAVNLFCGGAHPDSNLFYSTWNLDRGSAVDPWIWFSAKGATLTHPNETSPGATVITLSPALRDALLKGWTRDDDDCKDAAGMAAWEQLYPSTKGMVFQPYLPHVIQACADPVTLPWDMIVPLLNPEGRRAVESLRADFANPPAR
jgi:hypothetical protein